MQSRKISNKRGFLLVEVAIAVAIFSITVFGLVLLIATNSQTVTLETNRRIALFDSQKEIEESYANHTPTYSTPCLAKHHNSNLLLFQTDITQIKNLGNDCYGYSEKAFSETLTDQKIVALPASTTVTSLDTFNTLTFIGTQTEATSSKFFIIDTAGTIISSLDSANTNNLDVAGQYAYLATQGTANQFQIIDITDVSNPQIIARATLPGVTGSFPSGLSIFYYNKKVFIGTHRTAGNEFHIYDVSNPGSPQWLGSIELNHNINAIIVKDQYAYLATSGNTSDVIILDISNPNVIKKVTSVSLIGDEDVKSIFLLGTKLFVGRMKNTKSNPEFMILDISNLQNILVFASLSISATINNLIVKDTQTLLATSKGLILIDFSNLSSLIKKQITNLPVTSIDYEDDNIMYSEVTNLVINKLQ